MDACMTRSLPRDFILASGFFSSLYEDVLLKDASLELQVTIPNGISESALDNITTIFLHTRIHRDLLSQQDIEKDFVKDDVLDTLSLYITLLPQLLATSSFLQLQVTSDLLIQVLNYLAQVDDRRLDPLVGSINLFWLGDQGALNSAAKLWMGLIHLPLSVRDQDSSCYSSVKLLAGRGLSTTLLTLITFNNPDRRCAQLLTDLESTCRHSTGRSDYLSSVMKGKDPDFPNLVKSWVKKGYLHTLEVAASAELPRYDWFASEAAYAGQMSILKWAIQAGFRWRSDTLDGLVSSFRPPADLLWALENDAPRHGWALDSAASTGQLESLQLLTAAQCRNHTNLYHNAAQNGHLHILQWAMEQGHPYNPRTRQLAEEGGHTHIVAWCDTLQPCTLLI
jgi:hypothetical protein